ncbi:Protein NRT1/ PTR FAMILY 5.4 [Camellia lanceoleosa]|uniref:Protein NRT1/ PTR FAMILY 5.4 n=1 Tax=Camellia lanceoleosa TaxID=1840588 RepID=A0ACC0F817_9ERIC|nr:Protein NRT1/ PTR FAMILY 5.4 [Camellia lanceoleosa]
MIIVVVAVLWFGGRCNCGGKAGDGGEASGDAMGCGGMGEKLVDDGRNIYIAGLIYSNSMAVYVLTNLVTFLTDIWKLKLKHAVAIRNIKGGAAGIMGLVEAALVDAYFGHTGMLLITSVLYSIGLGLLVMSVLDRFFSKGIKSCPVGKKLCSSKLTASPFYWGLALIVLAKAVPQRMIQDKRKRQKNIIRNTCNIVGTAGGITWVFVSSIFAPDWSHQFLISACVMAIGIAIFFIGYAFLSPPQLHLDSIEQGTELNYGDEDQTPQGQGHNKKTPRVDEVEETKFMLRMVPISATFLLYKVIKSNSNTFFIAQGYAMNMSFHFVLQKKQYQIQLPIQIFRFMAGFATSAVKPLYRIVFEQRIERMNGRYSSGMKVGLGMLAALVCCKVAWLVEYIRLKSLKEHGLLGHPDDIAPISVFWLSSQFVLMGIMDGLARDGMEDFFKYQVPESMRKKYALVLTEAVIKWGKILNIGFIIVTHVVVEKLRVEDGSWIADTVNQSRLDLFYVAIVVVGIANLFIFAYVVSFYTYHDFPEEEDDEEEDPHEEIKIGKKQDKVEPTPDEETERTIRTT